MNPLRILLIVLFLATVAAAPASAAVTYLSAFRNTYGHLSQEGTLCCGAYGGSTNQFGPFNIDAKWPNGFMLPEGVVRVIMNSNVDSQGITATGTLIGDVPSGFAVVAEANVSVRFVLDAPTRYIGKYTTDPGTSYFAAVLPYNNGQPGPGGFGLPSQGVLPPGEYNVGVWFRKGLNHDGDSFVSNYSLHFLFIPEPSAAVLLLVAGLPLLTARRSR